MISKRIIAGIQLFAMGLIIFMAIYIGVNKDSQITLGREVPSWAKEARYDHR